MKSYDVLIISIYRRSIWKYIKFYDFYYRKDHGACNSAEISEIQNNE